MRKIAPLHWLFLMLPALATAAAPITQDVQPLGPLFLTPEQRQLLDAQRLEARPNGRLDGIVKRSSGYNSAWIDKRLHTEADGALPLTHPVGTVLPPAKP